MELISRKFVNNLINDQFGINKELNKDNIEKMYGLKPYKKEGRTILYSVKDVNSAGIIYERKLIGFYPIPSFEDKFWINKEGKIINVYDEKIVNSYIGTDLYEHIILVYYGKKYRKRVHSLMGVVFLGNPQVVNHKDGNKSKNKLYNLEKSTHSKNIKHAYDNNYYTTRGGTGTAVVVKSKETGEEVEFPSLRQAENHTGVDRHRIKRIIEGKNINKTNWEFKFK